MNIDAVIVRYKENVRGIFPIKNGTIKEINMVGVPVFCCEEMSAAWDTIIGFGEADVLNQLRTVNLYKYTPYPEGAVVDEYPINYCPFCGKEIIVKITEKT
jgi:hypothetical protein